MMRGLEPSALTENHSPVPCGAARVPSFFCAVNIRRSGPTQWNSPTLFSSGKVMWPTGASVSVRSTASELMPSICWLIAMYAPVGEIFDWLKRPRRMKSSTGTGALAGAGTVSAAAAKPASASDSVATSGSARRETVMRVLSRWIARRDPRRGRERAVRRPAEASGSSRTPASGARRILHDACRSGRAVLPPRIRQLAHHLPQALPPVGQAQAEIGGEVARVQARIRRAPGLGRVFAAGDADQLGRLGDHPGRQRLAVDRHRELVPAALAVGDDVPGAAA